MLILLFLISLVTRLIFLYWGFPSITHDEADFYLNGYVLSKTGANLAGDNLFLTFGSISLDGSIPVYIGSLFFRFFPKTVFFSRLPFAILNSLIPVLIYVLIKKITKKNNLAFITFLVVNFSPWFSYLSSQSAYNSPLALLFFLAMILALLSSLKKIFKYMLFLLFCFLSFNSYMGIKISFIFLIFIALLSKIIFQKRKINFKNLLKISFLSFLITALLTLLVYFAPGNQLFKNRSGSEIIFLNKQLVESKVWYERLVMGGSSLINKILTNKLTALFDLFSDRYLAAFNPLYLFVKGDPHPIYGTYYFGLFYLFEIIFLVVGVFATWEMLKKKQFALVPMLLLFIFAPLPTAVSTIIPSFALRSYPLIIPYAIVIAIGFITFWDLILGKNKLIQKNFYSASFLLYFLSFFFFFFVFQNKIKVFASEQWHYSEKILVEKISKIKNQYKKIYVSTLEPKETLYLYEFYNEKNGEKIKKVLNDQKIIVDNVVFQKKCPTAVEPGNLYLIKRGTCKTANLQHFIDASDKSGVLYYKIEGNK